MAQTKNVPKPKPKYLTPPKSAYRKLTDEQIERALKAVLDRKKKENR